MALHAELDVEIFLLLTELLLQLQLPVVDERLLLQLEIMLRLSVEEHDEEREYERGG